MVSIQYIFQIFKKNLNFLTVHLERFCDNKNLFFENGRQKINLIITFLKNEKIWILKMLYGKHLLDFWNTCTFFKIFFTLQLGIFFILSQSAWELISGFFWQAENGLKNIANESLYLCMKKNPLCLCSPFIVTYVKKCIMK